MKMSDKLVDIEIWQASNTILYTNDDKKYLWHYSLNGLIYGGFVTFTELIDHLKYMLENKKDEENG
jgi:hypothetical protein